jgi:hypothetical protein
MVRLDVPWWTFDAADSVDTFLRSRDGQALVFEYGPGASTVWLAKRCRKVYSVEHDARWIPKIRSMCSEHSNIELIFVDPMPDDNDREFGSRRGKWKNFSFKDYVNAIDGVAEKFDLIAVDGRSRNACLLGAVAKLKEDGIIVLDDSRRQRYGPAIRASALRTKRFGGLAPGLPYPNETTLLFR